MKETGEELGRYERSIELQSLKQKLEDGGNRGRVGKREQKKKL